MIWNQGNINKTKLNVQTFELSRHLADIESYFLKMEIMLGKDFHEDAQIEIVLNLKQARRQLGGGGEAFPVLFWKLKKVPRFLKEMSYLCLFLG